MNAVQVPLLVEIVLILTAMALGFFLFQTKKPYGKVRLSFHIFFAVWFAFGYYFVASAVWSAQGWSGTGIAILVMGVALLVQIASGLGLLLSNARRVLVAVHATSAFLVLVSAVVAFFLAAF